MMNKLFQWMGLDSFIDNSKTYFDNKLELIKLEIQELLSHIITAFVTIVLILFLGLMALALITIAIGNIINTLLESTYLGFLIMGLVYIVLLILVILKNEFVRDKISNWSLQLINNAIHKTKSDKIE